MLPSQQWTQHWALLPFQRVPSDLGISRMSGANDVAMAEVDDTDDPVALGSAGSGDSESGQARIDVEHSIESTTAVIDEAVPAPCANRNRTRVQKAGASQLFHSTLPVLC